MFVVFVVQLSSSPILLGIRWGSAFNLLLPTESAVFVVQTGGVLLLLMTHGGVPILMLTHGGVLFNNADSPCASQKRGGAGVCNKKIKNNREGCNIVWGAAE